MLKFSKCGRTYESGKALSLDLRRNVIDKILEEGGNRISRHIPAGYTMIASHFKIAPNTVKKIWTRFCEQYTEESLPPSRGRPSKLSQGDLELIEALKAAQGSISLVELWELLDEVEDIHGKISLSTLSRAVRNRLPSGRRYTRKKVTHIAAERFTNNNILYTQLFMNYINAKDPHCVKFYDDAGVQLPDAGTRKFGHSPVGERCVEVTRKCQSPNLTLSALCSLNGIEYAKVTDGATNTVEFLQFFEECGQSLNATTGFPCLAVGDIIVMDNLSCHHYQGGESLEEWLGEIGIELIYTPTYSPDLNPIEESFSKIKSVLTNDLVRGNIDNLKLAVLNATSKVTASDMYGYYHHTGYFSL